MSKHIHFTGACGRAIGSLAAALHQGTAWTVSASDDCQYAPMDQILKDLGLNIFTTYQATHIPNNTAALVIGSNITTDNVEVVTAKNKSIPIFNMAQFLKRHLLKKGKRIVVAGTNGKTTTTTMLTHILKHAGLHPDYLIGGTSPGLDSLVRFRGSDWTILEGDEYIAGKNDPQPKFLYYKPDVVVLTNLNYDHAEVFNNMDTLVHHFEKLVSQLPANGSLVIPYGDQLINKICKHSPAQVVTVGQSPQADYQITQVHSTSRGMTFKLNGQKLKIPSFGKMNIINAAMAVAAASKAQIEICQTRVPLSQCKNAAGRLEVLADNVQGTYVLDEGYHPEALRENIAALRLRFPNRHLTVALLPRFTGGNQGFQMDALPAVLAAADRVILAGVFDPVEFPGAPFSNRKLAARLKAHGTKTHVLKKIGSLPDFLQKSWIPHDVVLCSIPPGHQFIYAATIEWLTNQSSKKQ